MAFHRTKDLFQDENFQYVVDIDFELDVFLKYIEITAPSVTTQVREVIAEADKAYEVGREDLVDGYSYYVIGKTLRLRYESLVVSLYSFLEATMTRLCVIAQGNVGSKISCRDLSGNGIERNKTFLTKIGNVD